MVLLLLNSGMNIKEHLKVGVTGFITFNIIGFITVLVSLIITLPFATFIMSYSRDPNVNIIIYLFRFLLNIFVYYVSAEQSILYLRPISEMNCNFVLFYPTIQSLIPYFRTWPIVDYRNVFDTLLHIVGYIISIQICMELNRETITLPNPPINENTPIEYKE